jgi:hypothetical protein
VVEPWTLASVLETNGKKDFEKCMNEMNLNVSPKTFTDLIFGRSFSLLKEFKRDIFTDLCTCEETQEKQQWIWKTWCKERVIKMFEFFNQLFQNAVHIHINEELDCINTQKFLNVEMYWSCIAKCPLWSRAHIDQISLQGRDLCLQLHCKVKIYQCQFYKFYFDPQCRFIGWDFQFISI